MPNPCRNALPTTATAYSESQGRSTPGWSTPAPTPVRCCEALRPAVGGAERPRETRSLGRGVSWAVRRRGTPARAYRRPTLPLRARSLRQGCPVFLSCAGSVVPFRRPPQSRAAASRARSIPIWVVHARAQAGQNRVRQESKDAAPWRGKFRRPASIRPGGWGPPPTPRPASDAAALPRGPEGPSRPIETGPVLVTLSCDGCRTAKKPPDAEALARVAS